METKVYAILREYMKDRSVEISPEKSLIVDLGLTSIDLISAIGDFEDAFNIEIPDADLRRFQTVNDILEYLAENGL